MPNPIQMFIPCMLLATGISANHPSYANSSILIKNDALIDTIRHEQPELSVTALRAGIRAYDRLRAEGKDPKQVLTIVNFSEPSSKKRLWVINMVTGKTEYHTYVAQGEATGLNYAKYFSNTIDSHQSSIGVYLTGKAYYGLNGYSLRLHGLDSGFNSNVFKRHIVMHPAWYVSDDYVEDHGRLGRTYGCFGLDKAVSKRLIKTIKDGTVMVAYYPDPHWLRQSVYERA